MAAPIIVVDTITWNGQLVTAEQPVLLSTSAPIADVVISFASSAGSGSAVVDVNGMQIQVFLRTVNSLLNATAMGTTIPGVTDEIVDTTDLSVTVRYTLA